METRMVMAIQEIIMVIKMEIYLVGNIMEIKMGIIIVDLITEMEMETEMDYHHHNSMVS